MAGLKPILSCGPGGLGSANALKVQQPMVADAGGQVPLAGADTGSSSSARPLVDSEALQARIKSENLPREPRTSRRRRA